MQVVLWSPTEIVICCTSVQQRTGIAYMDSIHLYHILTCCVVFLDCMAEVKRVGAQVVVIATAQSKQQLQKDLLQARGKHVFEKVLEIAPPSLVSIIIRG